MQEGIDNGDTPSEGFSSLLSPLGGDTQSSTPAQTPQEFYGDYNECKQYYDSWSDTAVEIMDVAKDKWLGGGVIYILPTRHTLTVQDQKKKSTCD